MTGASPFVYFQDGVWQGLSIDVWEEVASANQWTFTYTSIQDRDKAIEALKNGEVDVIVGDISIVSNLFGSVEFSQPYFRAGLQIMISYARPHTLARLMDDLATWGHLKIFWYIVVIIVWASVLVALFERKHNPDFPKGKRDGLAEAFYYVISLSLGKSAYKGFPGWFGRVVMVLWIVAGIIIVAYVNGSITSVMTVEKMGSGKINGPADLPGHTVGVVQETTAINYLLRHGADVRQYPDMDKAVQALLADEVPAVVNAAPLLQYYDNAHQELPITEIGPVFAPYNYGFALQTGSALRIPLNASLLKLQESGVLLDIGRKYFGTIYQP